MSSPAISSNTLFHFVDKREWLIEVLKNNFRARYCLEKLDCIFPEDSRRDFWSVGIPMTCFCDLPLSSTYRHLEMYGGYGIGLTKQWGKSKGLSPILYVHDKSPLRKTVRASISALVYNLLDDNKNIAHLSDELIDTICFTKPYEGDFHRKGEVIPNHRFYDEREWRFVPENAIRLSEKDLKDEEIKENHYKILDSSLILEFTPDDIRYIIVDKEAEILEMMDEIATLKGSRYEYDQVRKLQTRIISAEQIRDDF